MKRIVSPILLIIIALSVYAQKRNKIDIGPFAGASYYLGDLNLSRHFYPPLPALGVIVKWPVNSRYAIRGNVTYGLLSAADADFNNPYQITRGYSMSTSVTELSTLVEFNYLPYIEGSDVEYYSPYLTAGITWFYSPKMSIPVQPAFPFGIGFKYNINPKLNVSLEWTFRRTFSDDLDGLSGMKIENLRTRQTAYFYNKDWYSYAGLSVTYKIRLWKGKCYGLE
ncbi:MAG: hypothetical protein KJ607_07825 [Bacteroidetes bacterium]|nr:hypothetical protein [Bacteroidota bacterium]